MKKDGVLRMKIEFEEKTIMDCKTNKIENLEEMFRNVKKKLK
jgi:hypothetical protein